MVSSRNVFVGGKPSTTAAIAAKAPAIAAGLRAAAAPALKATREKLTSLRITRKGTRKSSKDLRDSCRAAIMAADDTCKTSFLKQEEDDAKIEDLEKEEENLEKEVENLEKEVDLQNEVKANTQEEIPKKYSNAGTVKPNISDLSGASAIKTNISDLSGASMIKTNIGGNRVGNLGNHDRVLAGGYRRFKKSRRARKGKKSRRTRKGKKSRRTRR